MTGTTSRVSTGNVFADEILGGRLGLSDDELADLAARGVI